MGQWMFIEFFLFYYERIYMLEKLHILWNFMRGQRLTYTIAILSVILATIFSYASPYIVQYTIDTIIGDKPANSTFVKTAELVNSFLKDSSTGYVLLWTALALIFFTIITGIFSFYSGKLSASASEKITERIRNIVYDHIQHLPFKEQGELEIGDTIQRCTSDIETVRKFIAIQFLEIGRSLSMVGLALPLLFMTHSTMAWITLPVIPILAVSSFFFFVKVQRRFLASDEAEGRMSNILQENITGVRVVRAFAKQKYEIEKFDKSNQEYRDLSFDLIKTLASYWAFADSLSMIQIGVVLVSGSYLAIDGSLTIGELMLFLMLQQMLLWPIRQMGRTLADMGKALVSLGRIQEILNKRTEKNEKKRGLKPTISGNIIFDKVSFSYTKNRTILKDISFSVKAGTTVGILGPTGSGKSTLVQLLQRLVEYDSGSIKIDGTELKEISKQWIRNNITLVLQEPFLYGRSVKKNIGFAHENSSFEKIKQAAVDASVHTDIESFNNGYDTLVGEKGVTLSGGQKQRVAIARAVIRNTPIIVFDDSLSAVDNETDRTIRKALTKRNSNHTVFIISQRISTLAEADMTLVLDEGTLVQKGSHDELIREEGIYKKTWEMQHSLNKGHSAQERAA